jgi:hypothetical protein
MWVGLVLAATVVSLAEPGPTLPDEPSCPDPGEVETALSRLGVERGTRPEITVVGARMRIVLHDQHGLIVGSRAVAAPASCHERATVAAVMVATWMGVWPAGTKPAEPLAPPATTVPAIVPARPSSPTVSGGTAVGLLVLGAWDGQAFAAGLALESQWRLAAPLRGFVALSATTEREISVGPSRAGYVRPSLSAGPLLQLGSGKVRGEFVLSGRLGLLFIRGKDLHITHVTTRAVPGLSADLRVVVRGKTLSPFLALGGVFWLGREHLRLDDEPATAELPRWDAMAGVGMLWSKGL